MRSVYRGIDEPPHDKMVKEPERKKSMLLLPPDSAPNIVIRGLVRNPWDGLVDREKSIHGGTGIIE